jgi:ribonuclease HII
MPEPISISQMSLPQIQEFLSSCGPMDAEILNQLQTDGRRGVRQLCQRYLHQQDRRIKFERRFKELAIIERRLRRKGCRAVVGVDESGRGPLAGPLVAAAVMTPWPCRWMGLDDSKSLTVESRADWYQVIRAQAVAVGVGIVSASQIDRLGIQEATWRAMRQAIANLSTVPDHVIVDGPWTIPLLEIHQTPVVNGDARSISVAAASVVAKVTRDEIMIRLDEKFPDYEFAKHKGYGTREHLAALRAYGPCRQHRRSFQPVSVVLERQKGRIQEGPSETE